MAKMLKAIEKLIAQGIPPEKKRQIDDWIKRNNLNPYGDSKDTVYAGGTPLFDEMTGKTIDRYEYILKRHPELMKLLREK